MILPSGGEKKGGPDDESRIAIISENTRFALCALISWIMIVGRLRSSSS